MYRADDFGRLSVEGPWSIITWVGANDFLSLIFPLPDISRRPSLVRRVTDPHVKSFQRQSNFLTTNRMLRLFSAGASLSWTAACLHPESLEKRLLCSSVAQEFLLVNTTTGNKEPNPGAKIVYIDGGWDMFHAGHIEILEMAKRHGDYVIVGVHNDALVNKQYGSNYPILNMQVCSK